MVVHAVKKKKSKKELLAEKTKHVDTFGGGDDFDNNGYEDYTSKYDDDFF